MNAMLLLAQVATNLADSVASANPVLTPVSAPAEMNMLDMAIKGGWIMIVLAVLSVVCFYILFERNYMIRKAGKEDPMFMEKIKDYIHSGEIKSAINYCRTINTPSYRGGQVRERTDGNGYHFRWCTDAWLPGYGNRYGAGILRNGECRKR